MDSFDRVIGLIGKNAFDKLQNSSVILFGVGGVGGFVAEALVRSGVGSLTVVDNDTVSVTNINRQIIADTLSVGQDKVSVIKARLLNINPKLNIDCVNAFVLPDNIGQIDFGKFNYVIDAVDTVSAKIAIIESAKKVGVKVITCMGTAGKLDTLKIRVADVSKTDVCPLARVMRRELKKRQITGVKAVYSIEEQNVVGDKDVALESKGNCGRVSIPSMIFVPATAGLTIASEVIKDLIGE